MEACTEVMLTVYADEAGRVNCGLAPTKDLRAAGLQCPPMECVICTILS